MITIGILSQMTPRERTRRLLELPESTRLKLAHLAALGSSRHARLAQEILMPRPYSKPPVGTVESHIAEAERFSKLATELTTDTAELQKQLDALSEAGSPQQDAPALPSTEQIAAAIAAAEADFVGVGLASLQLLVHHRMAEAVTQQLAQHQVPSHEEIVAAICAGEASLARDSTVTPLLVHHAMADAVEALLAGESPR